MKHLPKRWLLADRQIQNVIKVGALALAFLSICLSVPGQLIEKSAIEVKDSAGTFNFNRGFINSNNRVSAAGTFMVKIEIGDTSLYVGTDPKKGQIIAQFGTNLKLEQLQHFGGYGWLQWIHDLETDTYGNLYLNSVEDSFIVFGTDTLKEVPPPSGMSWGVMNFGYTVSFDKSGKYRWSYQLYGDHTRTKHLATNTSGSIYISGHFNDWVIFRNDTLKDSCCRSPLLIKLDSNGKEVWAKQFISTFRNAEITAMDCDSLGNLYLAVHIEDKEIEINGQTYYAKNGHLLVVALDTSGNTRWVRQVKGGYSNGYEIRIGRKQKIIMAGVFSDSISIGGIKIYESFDNYNYLCSFDTDGKLNWLKKVGGGGSVTIDVNDEAIYLSSVIRDGAAYIGDTVIVSPSGLGNFFLTKYDYEGNYQWVYAIIGDYSGSPEWLSVNEHKEIALGISYRYEFVFKGDTFRQPDGLWQSGIILRLQDTSGIKPVGADEENIALNEVIIYPNPAQTRLTLYSGHSSGTKLGYDLFNLQGIRLAQGEFTATEGGTYKTIDISALSQGVYLFMLHEGNATTTKKLVIQR